MANSVYLDYDVHCSAVIVTLKNGALATHNSSQGLYQISEPFPYASNPLNARQTWTFNMASEHPYWTSDSYVIWYYHGSTRRWAIGGEAGSVSQAIFYAFDDFGGLDDDNNQWHYRVYPGLHWMAAGANDVNVTCTSKLL